MNSSLEEQQNFVEKLYKRCSHSIERPSMVDRGIQVSTVIMNIPLGSVADPDPPDLCHFP